MQQNTGNDDPKHNGLDELAKEKQELKAAKSEAKGRLRALRERAAQVDILSNTNKMEAIIRIVRREKSRIRKIRRQLNELSRQTAKQ